MLELLLWFPWAGLWFWALGKLPFREAVRRVSWVIGAIGVPLTWAVSQLPLQERVVLGAFGGVTLVGFVIIAWLISDPPMIEPGAETATQRSRPPLICYREQPAKQCSWEMCRERCVFGPET
ncbi:hypothetical protein [Streptomyces sp. CAI-17]|uniref:hypothetical protein n=1 Tax=Streptomyces sp. CAI-17 TaxID=1169742 RepID=UPI001595DAC1|nr:hypothetical protein [Streptomyces sp. CAI-17]